MLHNYQNTTRVCKYKIAEYLQTKEWAVFSRINTYSRKIACDLLDSDLFRRADATPDQQTKYLFYALSSELLPSNRFRNNLITFLKNPQVNFKVRLLSELYLLMHSIKANQNVSAKITHLILLGKHEPFFLRALVLSISLWSKNEIPMKLGPEDFDNYNGSKYHFSLQDSIQCLPINKSKHFFLSYHATDSSSSKTHFFDSYFVEEYLRRANDATLTEEFMETLTSKISTHNSVYYPYNNPLIIYLSLGAKFTKHLNLAGTTKIIRKILHSHCFDSTLPDLFSQYYQRLTEFENHPALREIISNMLEDQELHFGTTLFVISKALPLSSNCSDIYENLSEKWLLRNKLYLNELSSPSPFWTTPYWSKELPTLRLIATIMPKLFIFLPQRSRERLIISTIELAIATSKVYNPCNNYCNSFDFHSQLIQIIYDSTQFPKTISMKLIIKDYLDFFLGYKTSNQHDGSYHSKIKLYLHLACNLTLFLTEIEAQELIEKIYRPEIRIEILTALHLRKINKSNLVLSRENNFLLHNEDTKQSLLSNLIKKRIRASREFTDELSLFLQDPGSNIKTRMLVGIYLQIPENKKRTNALTTIDSVISLYSPFYNLVMQHLNAEWQKDKAGQVKTLTNFCQWIISGKLYDEHIFALADILPLLSDENKNFLRQLLLSSYLTSYIYGYGDGFTSNPARQLYLQVFGKIDKDTGGDITAHYLNYVFKTIPHDTLKKMHLHNVLNKNIMLSIESLTVISYHLHLLDIDQIKECLSTMLRYSTISTTLIENFIVALKRLIWMHSLKVFSFLKQTWKSITL
jgi:hypothetical protein